MNSAALQNGSAPTRIVATMTLLCPAAIAMVAMKMVETTMVTMLLARATRTAVRVVALPVVLEVAVKAEMVTVEMGAMEVVVEAAEVDGVAIAVADVAVKLALMLERYSLNVLVIQL